MDQPDKVPASPAKVKLTPSAVVRYLDQHVIGQDEAKRALAVVVYQHYKKITHANEATNASAAAIALGKDRKSVV